MFPRNKCNDYEKELLRFYENYFCKYACRGQHSNGQNADHIPSEGQEDLLLSKLSEHNQLSLGTGFPTPESLT